MEKGQIKIVAQQTKQEKNWKSTRQLPAFFVQAFDFGTARMIVKDLFEGSELSGQMENSVGDIEDL